MKEQKKKMKRHERAQNPIIFTGILIKIRVHFSYLFYTRLCCFFHSFVLFYGGKCSFLVVGQKYTYKWSCVMHMTIFH